MLVTEQLSGTTNLKVVSGELETDAELTGGLDGFEALAGVIGHGFRMGREQVGIGLAVGAADAPPELVQLSESETVRAVDHDGVRIRDVDSRFDDCRTDEHVGAPVIEIAHDLLELALPHLTVTDRHARFRYEFGELPGCTFDRSNFVVHIEDLASTQQFPENRFFH